MSHNIIANRDGKYTLPTQNCRCDQDIVLDVQTWASHEAYSGSFSIPLQSTGLPASWTINLGFTLPKRFFIMAKSTTTPVAATSEYNYVFYGFQWSFDGSRTGTAYDTTGSEINFTNDNLISVSYNRQQITFSAGAVSGRMAVYGWNWLIVAEGE